MKKRICWIVPALVLGFSLAGCVTDPDVAYFLNAPSGANIFVARVAVDVEKVAIMPFKAATELIGSSISDMLVTEISRTRRYTLVERSQMAKVLGEAELSLAGLSEAEAIKAGTMLGADAVIIGTVDEYGTVAQGGRTYPVVGISIRLIECRSGKVLWSADLARRADEARVTQPEQARRVAHEIVAGLYRKWASQPRTARASAGGPAFTAPVGVGVSASAGANPVEPPPKPPEGLSLSDGELRQITIRWTPPVDTTVTSCRIERADAAEGPFLKVASAAPASGEYVDSGGRTPLKDGAAYYYRLVAVRGAQESAPCAARAGRTAPPPDPPPDVAAASPPVPQTIRLSWTASCSVGVAKYLVERGEQPAGPFRPIGETPQLAFADTGSRAAPLRDGTRYWYRVRAVNAVGAAGEPSAPPAAAATLGAPEPVAAIEAASGLPRMARLKWAVPADATVTGYELQRNAPGERDFVTLARLTNAAATAYTDRGAAAGESGPGALADGADYRYRVRSLNPTSLASAWSETAVARTRPLPPAPRDVRVEYSSGEARLSWTVPDNGGVVSFRVSKDGDREPLARPAQPGLALSWSDVGAGLSLRLTSLDADGLESIPAGPVKVEETPPPVPEAPSVGRDGLREVVVRWTPPSNRARQYRIERADSKDGPFAAVATADAAAGTYRDAGRAGAPLPDSATFHYRLVAIAAGGRASEPGPGAEAQTAPPPPPPASIRAEAPSSRAARVTWSASSGAGIVKYIVERSGPDAAGAFVRRAEVEGTDFLDGGKADSDLRDSSTYSYRVTAVNRVGSVGAPSDAAEVVTRPPPAVVQGLDARGAEVRCVPLAWTASPEADVVRYDLYRRDGADGEFVKLASVPGREKTSFLDGGADPGNLEDEHRYEYRIRAVNAVTSESADSDAVFAVTRPVPPVVTGLKAKGGLPREVPIAWDASPDEKVVGYEIRRRAPGETDFAPIGRVQGRERATYTDRGRASNPSGLGALADGTAYEYAVVAVNTAQATSAPCEAVAASTKPAPAAPAGVAASTAVANAIEVTWKANPEADIASYVVEASASADGRFREVATPRATAADTMSCTDGDRDAGERRFYRVKAIDRDTLESAWSETVPGNAKPRPEPPTNLQATWVDGAPTITWTAPPQPDIRRYRIWKKGTFRSSEIGFCESTGRRLDPAQAGAGTSVYVTAVDADELESEPSAAIAIPPPTAGASR